jgi:hypothetical protein
VSFSKGEKTYLTTAFLIYVVTTGYISYLARYETIYSVGVYAVIAIQVLGLFVLAVTLLFSRFNYLRSLKAFAFAVSLIQFVFIIVHEIDHYKPTYVITIPSNYEGCIYLFVTRESRSDVFVDERGIGYVGSTGKAKWEIRRGNECITDAFSTSQHNEIIVRDSSNTLMIAYDVSCLEINESNHYPPRPYDKQTIPCMDSPEFLELVEQGVINEKLLRKKVWKGNGDESSWVFDSQESRL